MLRRDIVPEENIPSAFMGNNAIMIAHVAKLYVRPDELVADVTFNTGKFWTKTDTSRFGLLKSDLYPQSDDTLRMDFRNLSYANETINHVIMDPPFIHHPRSRYNKDYNTDSTSSLDHAGLMDLYRAGMREAHRVLCRSGMMWIKCMDEVQGGRQKRSSIAIFNIAVHELGMRDKDKFSVLTYKTFSKRWSRQLHSRKNISELWIFQKR